MNCNAKVTTRRFGMYGWPFWKLTRWGLIRTRYWGYEEHDNYGETERRAHWYVLVPLVGKVVFWRALDRPYQPYQLLQDDK